MKIGLYRGSWGAALLGAAIVLAGCPDRMTDFEKHVKDGNDFFSNGSYEKAEAEFDKAVELHPGEAGVLTNRGNARMMLGREEEAMTDYEAALELDPKFAKGYANRGILRDRLGDTDGAIEDYRRALELDPELGEGPSIWKRVISDPPTETIRERMLYLRALREPGTLTEPE